MKSRIGAAVVVYSTLAILAGVTLDGNIRLATWIFLAGLAVKCLINSIQQP